VPLSERVVQVEQSAGDGNTCNLPSIRSPLWTRRTAEVGWAKCKRGDRELDGSVTSKLIMFPGWKQGRY